MFHNKQHGYYTMSKSDWGPCTWESMHHFAIAYSCRPTPTQQEWAIRWLLATAHMLPCVECKNHFLDLLEQFPPDVTDSCSFQTWMFEAHNMVNQRLGKPVFSLAQYHRKYGRAISIHKENRRREEALGWY